MDVAVLLVMHNCILSQLELTSFKFVPVRAMTVKYLSKLDAVYRSYLMTQYFVKGWGDSVNIQK